MNSDLATVLAGIFAGFFTSPSFAGVWAAVFRKTVFGDWDVGYQWSVSDLFFWTISWLEGWLGASLLH